MRILLSAFACSPTEGSEARAGWRFALELAQTHEVVVLTDEYRRPAIEAELAQAPRDNPRFVFYRPAWLRPVPFRGQFSRLLYVGWQYSLLPFARRLHRQYRFDVVWHLTWGVFRHPSFLGFLGIPFVLGPIGGGEDAPLRLKRSIHGRDKLAENLRMALNYLAHVSPILWWAFARADLIFTRTPHTARMLPYGLGRRAICAQEIGATPRIGVLAKQCQSGPLRILFAGRLLALKGCHLALRAVAVARSRGLDIRFTLIGSGPYEAELKRLSRELGDAAEFVAHVSQEELFGIYREMDCFLFPSLRDSGGTVVLEALSFALPVICLDNCGPAEFVDETCGVVVATANQDEAGVVHGLAAALELLAGNPAELTCRSVGALARADHHRLENQVGRMLARMEQLVADTQSPTRRKQA